MILLNPLLKKLHIERAELPDWMVFLKRRSFVKWNNPEFTNISSFTLLLMCSTHFKLSCRKLHALSTCNSFVQFVFAEIPVQSGGWAPIEAAWCWVLLCPMQFIRTGLVQILDSDIWDLAASCRKFLYFISCLCLVFCIQMHWRVHNLTDTFGHLRVFLRTG